MLRAHGLIPLAAAGASLFLALFVYGAAPDRRLGKIFGILAVTLVFWNLNIFALYAFHDYSDALEYSRLFRTGSLFLLPAILHLSLVLPGRPIGMVWKALLVVDYSVSAILACLNVAGLLVTKLATFYWGYYSVGSVLYDVFTFSVFVNFLAAAGLLVREYVTTREPRTRLQLKFWLFGMAIALPLGLTNLLPAYGVRMYPLGNLGSAVWAAIVGYAIVRHRLMDIEVVVTKGLAYVGVSIIIIGPIVLSFTFLQYWAFGEIHYDFSAAVVVLFIIVAIVFPWVRIAVERRLGWSLFRSKFETREALDSLANEVVRILDRQKLLVLLCDGVGDAFGIERVALYLADEVRGAYELVQARGLPPKDSSLLFDHRLVRRLLQASDAVLREELEGTERGGGAWDPGVMNNNLWDVAVPFRSGRQLIGFVCLGPKRELEAFTVGDLSLLGKVAAETAVALQNARVYEELRRSRAIISRAGRLSAIGTLAAGIAHEIRNPLVSIQTFFQLAPHRLDDEEFMTSFLKLAEAEVQRISSLISELLMFAKSPAPALRSIDIKEAAERAVILLEPQARAQGVNLRLRMSQLRDTVLADADQIMQVLLNLGLNAVQATPRGGEVCLENRVTMQDGARYCEVEIRDTGSGIPDALRESIFDPFFTTKDKGTGLGLAIAHQIIAECGGFISVTSEEGMGSRFVVSLPAEDRIGRGLSGEQSVDQGTDGAKCG